MTSPDCLAPEFCLCAGPDAAIRLIADDGETAAKLGTGADDLAGDTGTRRPFN